MTLKTAIVTGGSRGIGLAISAALAASGRRVVLTCREDIERAEEAASEIRSSGGEALSLVADVTTRRAVKALGGSGRQDFGARDILVNNAGIIKDALLPFLKEEDWDAVLDVDLKGAFRMSKSSCGMLHRKWGRIVNVVSVSGSRDTSARPTTRRPRAG